MTKEPFSIVISHGRMIYVFDTNQEAWDYFLLLKSQVNCTCDGRCITF